MLPRPARTSRRRGVIRAALALAGSAALAAGVLVGASPAQAAGNYYVTMTGVQPTGTLGVNQYLTITTSLVNGSNCGSVMATPVWLYWTVNNPTTRLGQATFQTCTPSGDFQYLYAWNPSQAQVWYIQAQASDGSQSQAYRSAINTGSTTTTVAAPNTAKVGAATTLTATVAAANGGTFSAQGTVQFSILGGGNIGGPVTLSNAIPSTASIQWTPATVGTFSVVATYTPVNAGTPNANTNCGSSCTSAPDVVSVTTSGVNVYLANPPAMAAGIPATLTAVVSAVPSSGTVTFTVNGSAFAANVPVNAAGQAQATWTPPAAGTYTIGAGWVGTSGQTGTSADVVSVGAAPAQSDQIVIVTANGTTLVPGSSYSVPNGTKLTFTSSTASGSPLTYSTTGPCTISAGSFSANSGTGTCLVTAASPGGNGFGPATNTVTVNLVPGNQTAKLAAPASGNVNVGKTLTLAKASQGKTNIGKPISWKITKGKGSVCSLSFPSSGAVKLKINAKGKCSVKASAAGVSGQWNPYSLTRTYTGK